MSTSLLHKPNAVSIAFFSYSNISLLLGLQVKLYKVAPWGIPSMPRGARWRHLKWIGFHVVQPYINRDLGGHGGATWPPEQSFKLSL